MTLSRREQTDLEELFDLLASRAISQEDQVCLNELLRSQEEARLAYVQYFGVDAALGMYFSGMPASGFLRSCGCGDTLGGVFAELAASRSKRSGTAEVLDGPPVLGFLGMAVNLSASWLSSPKVMVLTIASCLATYFLGLAISIAVTRAYVGDRNAWPQTDAGERAVAQASAVKPRTEVGSFSANVKAHWLRPSEAPQDRTARIGEPYDLASGRTYLRLAMGVQLMIEGPARWEFTSEQRVLFHGGRLMAEVPRAAVGFTVATPTADVVDLGTEFGVVVDEQNTTDVIVYRGQVAVTPQVPASESKPEAKNQPAVVLWAGQSNRISAGGGLTPIKPSEFGNSTGRESSIRGIANVSGGKFTSGVVASEADIEQGPFVVASDLGTVPTGRPTMIGAASFVANAGGYFAGHDYNDGVLAELANPALNKLLQTQRCAPALSAAIPVVVGKRYVLQLLFFEPGGLKFIRPMTIRAEGDELRDYNITSSGSICSWVKYEFTAEDAALDVEISLIPKGNVDNVTISGFLLTEITQRRSNPDAK